MNHFLFEDILNSIYDQKIKEFTVECLKSAPDELNVIPASTSGKYHPEECCKEGGLVAHIRRACFFGKILADARDWNAQDIRGDVLLSALLLHDIGKKGSYGRDFKAYVNHPIVAAQMIEQFKHIIPVGVFATIKNCVLHHMGPFGPESTKKKMEDYTTLELMTYYADYLSSKKCFTISKNGE